MEMKSDLISAIIVFMSVLLLAISTVSSSSEHAEGTVASRSSGGDKANVVSQISKTGHTLGSLADSLNKFGRLQHIDIKHKIVKRSTDRNQHDQGHILEVQFHTLGRHFYARLKSTHDVIAKDFAAYVVDAQNSKTKIKDDLGELYQGYLVDEPESKIFAHWEGHALLAKIQTKSEIYYIEPAWRFLNESSLDEMITYKASDMKNDARLHKQDHIGSNFCGFISVPVQYGNTSSHEDSRVRRRVSSAEAFPGAPIKNTCPLLLVADYRFFENMGQKSASRTTTYLLGLIDRVDSIYRKTDFGKEYKGLGFEVKEIRIHEAPMTAQKGVDHYNILKDKWDTKQLLEAFSRNDYSEFCLAHLFTALADEKSGMLGLSYVAKASIYKPGGVCNHQVYYKGGHALYLNTGWSSSLNSYKRRILTQEADLVTTHEFGHNWGSEHDPDTKACSPSGDAGGKYIMYTYSVPGYDKHNKLFSPCSKAAMQEVLESKAHICFTEPQGAYCGNQKIEGDEECDGGALMRRGHDACCHTNCKLRLPAVCSDANHICCQECQYLSSSVICRDGSNLDAGCEATTNCTGLDGDCPEPAAKADYEKCLNRGQCMNGKCQPFCESLGNVSCICDNAEDSCRWCCRETRYSNCTPYIDHGNYIPLTNGTPCVQGYCNKGVCEKHEGELVQRIWSIIENLNPSRLVAFMRANIVGTVIILSLFLWIPGSCLIWCLDRRQQLDDDDTANWLNVQNATLTRTWVQPAKFPSLERGKRRTARLCQNIQMNQAKLAFA